jgi:hypothetical protein
MKKLRSAKGRNMSKVTEMVNGEAGFKDRQPDFRVLTINHHT